MARLRNTPVHVYCDVDYDCVECAPGSPGGSESVSGEPWRPIGVRSNAVRDGRLWITDPGLHLLALTGQMPGRGTYTAVEDYGI